MLLDCLFSRANLCNEAPHSQFLEIQCKRVRRCSYNCDVWCYAEATRPIARAAIIDWGIISVFMFWSPVSQVILIFHAHHNIIFLRTENGYPLQIEVKSVRCENSPVNKEFLLNVLPKVNYPALRSAVQQMSHHCEPPLPEIPENLDVSDTEGNKNLDDETMTNLHRVLLDVYLVEGWLVCPDTGRKFPVKDSIPNMILHEDEI